MSEDEQITLSDIEKECVAFSTVIIVGGVFVGGYILKILLEFLGYKNDGDMAIPVILYCAGLVIFGIFFPWYLLGKEATANG